MIIHSYSECLIPSLLQKILQEEWEDSKFLSELFADCVRRAFMGDGGMYYCPLYLREVIL